MRVMTSRAGVKRAFSCLVTHGATQKLAAMGLRLLVAYAHAVSRLRDTSISWLCEDPMWSTKDGQLCAHAA